MGSCLCKKSSNNSASTDVAMNEPQDSPSPKSPTAITELQQKPSTSMHVIVKSDSIEPRVTLTANGGRESWNMSPIESNLDLDGGYDRLEFQLKMQRQETERKFQDEEREKR